MASGQKDLQAVGERLRVRGAPWGCDVAVTGDPSGIIFWWKAMGGGHCGGE